MRWSYSLLATLALWFACCRASFALQPPLPPGSLPTGTMSGMFPFALPPFDDSPSPTDVSFLNDAPAGKWGFVRTMGESFVDGRGQKLRFWGVNLNFVGVFPSKNDAPHIAGRLAKFGFNAVRLHHFEGNAAPNGLWQSTGRPGSNVPKWPLVPDSDQQDRLDFFVSELIKRGIYVDFNLHVARKSTEADGLPMAAQLPEKDKGIAYFEPQLVAKNREFARMLLSHVNPYTRRAYKDEPGVCAIEVENENSILAMWLDGSLSRLPASYSERLRLKWNDWLREKYPSETRLRRAWTEVDMPLSSVDLLSPPNPVAPVPTPTPAAFVTAPGFPVITPTASPTPTTQNLPVVTTAMPAVTTTGVQPSPLGLQGWVLNTAGGAVGRLERDELGGPSPNGIVQPGLSARLDRAGSVTWAFQAVRDGLTLDSGKPYTFSFWARSDTPRQISVNLWEDVKPYRWMGVTQNVKLTPDWQQFVIAFRPVGTTPGHARLAFNFSNATGLVQLGNLTLVAGGRIGTPDAWTMRNGVPLIDAKSEPIFAARRDFARFLGSLESDYLSQMRTFLRNDLGVKVPIWHTQAQFGGWGGVVREMNSDAVDVHIYWKHPDISASGWSGPTWRIENQSMAFNPLNDPLAIYALMRPPGKPFVVTEWNSGQPNDYGSESLLMAAAYAAQQDWAGVWMFDYHSAGAWDRNKFENFFSIDSHPSKMATSPAAAMLFRRGDVASSGTSATLAFAPDKEWDEVANTPSLPTMGPFFKTWNNAGATRGVALVGRTSILNTSSAFASPSVASLDVPNQFVSDTGQIVRDGVRGTWTVNTPRSKAWVGNWGSSRFRLGEVEAWFPPGDTFHAGSLISLDGGDLGRSKQMLLTLAGRAENTGMGWNAARDSVGTQWGDGPTRVRVPQGTFKVCCEEPSLKVWALDERGQRRAQINSVWTDGILKFTVSPDDKTLWYEIAPETPVQTSVQMPIQ